jgi:hypothetical protein
MQMSGMRPTPCDVANHRVSGNGGVASTFHVGHPGRAVPEPGRWPNFTKWSDN